MICELTQQPFTLNDRTLIVATSQKAEVQRVVAGTGLETSWLTGTSAIREYSDTGEPDFTSPSSWILVVVRAEDAPTLQAALDLA